MNIEKVIMENTFINSYNELQKSLRVEVKIPSDEVDRLLLNRLISIRNFEGNEFLELYQDKHDARIFFTYSYWRDEEALEKYRKSALFNEVWTYTKTLFADKPEAWSVNKLHTLE